MKIHRLIPVLMLAAVLGGCSPYVISYNHFYLDEADGVQILERSTKSLDTQGKPLAFARSQMPLKAMLTRDNYQIKIDTPLNIGPVVFLTARAPDGTPLLIEGVHIHPVASGSAKEIEGYQYSFYVDGARGTSLEFTVRSASNAELGSERLNYSIRSRGISYGIESV